MPGRPVRFSFVLFDLSSSPSIIGRKAVFSITAVKRMTLFKTSTLSAAAQALAPHLQQYKDESEKVSLHTTLVLASSRRFTLLP